MGKFKRTSKLTHFFTLFAPICATRLLSNFAFSYSGKSYISNSFHPQTTLPPRSAVLLTPHRSCRAREKHALPYKGISQTEHDVANHSSQKSRLTLANHCAINGLTLDSVSAF